MEDNAHTQTVEGTRATRSAKPHGEAAPPELLFDFEHEHEVGKHRRLEIVPRRLNMSGTPLLLEGVGATRTAIGGMVLDIERGELPPPSGTQDPLPNTLYEAFHRKMRRQENRWLEMDVQESHETAEQLELLQNRLAMPAWQPALLRATHVAHPDDPDEMLRMRARTQRRLAQMLHSYRRMQRRAAALRHKSGSSAAGGASARGKTQGRPGKGALDPARDWARMYRRVDRLFVEGYGASSDEDEEAMAPAEIRAHRDRARRAACGGRITVGLTAGPQPPMFAIVAEPLQQPYVLKLTTQERREVVRAGIPQKVFRYPGAATQAAATVRRRVAVPRTFVLSEEQKREYAREFAAEAPEGPEGPEGKEMVEDPGSCPSLAALAAGSPSSDVISDVPEDTPSELRLVSLGASDVSGGAPRSSPAPGLGAIVPSSPVQGGCAGKSESSAFRGALGESAGAQIATVQNSHSLHPPVGVVLGNGAFVQASGAMAMVQGGVGVSGAVAAEYTLPLDSAQQGQNHSERNSAQPLPDQSSATILIPRKKRRPSPENVMPKDSVSTPGPSQHSPVQTPNVLIPRKKQKVKKTLQ
ncbi:Sas4 protein [Maudiozyma humilis]|uniref:Sas4 protein n=1 Tax=Maudiozyma humilis TaxID=51915 RepID=A0AAV5RY73_MAUHU|nr:Sas4 protein [Kazachstania humilis]